jgi:hypothetical protein
MSYPSSVSIGVALENGVHKAFGHGSIHLYGSISLNLIVTHRENMALKGFSFLGIFRI